MGIRRFNDLIEKYRLSFEFQQTVINQAAMHGLNHEEYMGVAGDIMESLGPPGSFPGGYAKWRSQFMLKMKEYRESGSLQSPTHTLPNKPNDWKRQLEEQPCLRCQGTGWEKIGDRVRRCSECRNHRNGAP